MMTPTEIIKDNVDNGATLLDVAYPNWYKEINPYQLDMTNSNNCIIGQLFGNYAELKRNLDVPFTDAHKFGFTLAPNRTIGITVLPIHWDILQEAWEAEIAVRYDQFSNQ